MVIGQQELTPNILGDVGEALSGATADTGPKHKPHGPKGRLMGSQIALCVPGCSRVFRSTSQTSRRVGSSFPSLGAEQIPAGSEHLEGLLMQEGTAAALGGHPSPLPCSAPASHCVSLSPLGGGQWARGIFAGGKSWPERGRDGDAGGGSSHSHSSGGVGALGEGGGGGPCSKGCWAPCPAGRLLSNPSSTGGITRAGAERRGLSELRRQQRGGSLGAGGAGASRLAELVLLAPPVAHLEQKFRGCPSIDAVPGCHRESSAAASRGDAACCCPSPSPPSPARRWHRPHHSAWKKLLAWLWDKLSQQQCVVPTSGFTFPWPCSLAWKSRQPPASGSGTAGEGGGSGSMAARGLEAPGLLLPDSCQTSAAGGSQLQPSSGGKTTEEGSSREGQPAQHACHLGWGTPIWQGGAARCPQTVLLEPPAPLALPCCLWHGLAPQGHWVTCPGSHGSSVAETGSIDCGSLNPPLFPTSTEADSVPGPKERGLGEMRPLFLFWL